MTTPDERPIVEGRPVLVVIDIQGGAPDDGAPSALPFMSGYQAAVDRAPALVDAARRCGVPVVFFQEAHRRDLVDFGRELDGAEGIHLLEGDAGTEISSTLGAGPDDYVIRKRRYSCFFGTEFEILLKAPTRPLATIAVGLSPLAIAADHRHERERGSASLADRCCYATSKRSRFMTLSHAATKSVTNFCLASSAP